jgi:hypothetical protein
MIAIALACILLAPSAPQTEIGEPLVGLPDTATVVEGKASWYCGAGSRCTKGFPASGLYAAAGPALRVGDWRGRVVEVRLAGYRGPCDDPRTTRLEGPCTKVRLIDFCACSGKVVDLYRGVFAKLADPDRGIIPVQVSWGEGEPATLPPTSTLR